MHTNNFTGKTNKLFYTIANILHVSEENTALVRITLAAYLLCAQMKSTYNNLFSYEDLLGDNECIPTEVKPLVREYLTEDEWDNLKRLISDYSYEDALAIAVSATQENQTNSSFSTPHSIIKLSERVLDFKPDDEALDLCCGSGSFSFDALISTDLSAIDAVDISTLDMDVLTIRSQLIEKKVHPIRKNAFSLSSNKKYDKVFANYPFMIRNLKGDDTVETFLGTISNCPPITSRSSDWVFNALIMSLLKEDGKAIAIMTNGSTFNRPDLPWRKLFVEKGYIEKIIALPPALFSITSIPTTLIVFSFGNERIRMIDATKICHSERRYNYLNDSDLESILNSFENDLGIACYISKEEARKKDYDLYPIKYLTRDISFSNEVKFGTILRNVRLGSKMPAQQTAELTTDEVTGYYYLQMNAIQNGIVDTNLPNIRELDSKYLKHCARRGEMVFPKNYAPGKIAVLDCNLDDIFFVSSNMYVLELDLDKVNPYYVAAFFDSSIGRELLTGSRSGAIIPIISVSTLKELPFPLPDMKQQQIVAEKYLSAMDEIKIYRAKLNQAIEKLTLAFEEEGDYLA